MSYREYLLEYQDQQEEQLSSDSPKSTDTYMYSNAKALSIYGNGKRFEIEDNTLLYEIVKIVKDVIDRHFFQVQVQLYTQIADRHVVFTLVMDKNEVKYSYFVETLFVYICNQIYKNFGNIFDIHKEETIGENNKIVLKIKVEKHQAN